jgi:hypothetical protein
MAQAQLQELVTLEQLLRRLSREVHQTQLTATNSFARLAPLMTNLTRTTAEQADSSAPDSGETPRTVSEAQYHEFVRQAGSFAIEVNALSKRLAAIIQEMRTGIVPFHLESGGGQSDTARASAGQPDPEPTAMSY